MAGRQGIQAWVLASAGVMLLGAFGPWVKGLGQSVSGIDGSNDGWLVIAAAGLGGLLFYATRTSRGAGVWPLLGGGAGIAITLYDRSNVQHAIDQGGALTAALVSVGWGLNVALLASASLALAGLISMAQTGTPKEAPLLAEPVPMPPDAFPQPPPSVPTSPVSSSVPMLNPSITAPPES